MYNWSEIIVNGLWNIAIYQGTSESNLKTPYRGGRVVRWCWVNFQCWGVLLIWIRVGQGPTALEVGADGGCLDILSRLSFLFFLHIFGGGGGAAQYRLKYFLKGPLSPK